MSFKRKVKRQATINYIKKQYGRIFCPKCHEKLVLKDETILVCEHCGWFKKERAERD
jgi:ribosomal protein L37AE/L43A